jgi:hypothetical protein
MIRQFCVKLVKGEGAQAAELANLLSASNGPESWETSSPD